MYSHKIVNTNTGEETIVPLSDAETKVIEANIAQAKVEAVEAEAKATQKAALLNRLGITEDEAKLLLS
jgi:hypothetical protein